jgi:NADH:ubiquinone oxidoreductase subunit E
MAEPIVNAEVNLEQLKEIIAEYSQQRWPLIPLVQRIQHEFGYIPPQSIPIPARALRLFPSQVQGVISFYEQPYDHWRHDYGHHRPSRG